MNNENRKPINSIEEELDKEIKNLEEIIKELNQWKRTFPNQTPEEVKSKLDKYSSQIIAEEERKSYLNQIQRLETLLTSQNKNTKIVKKETKVCEICQQVRQDNFEYSRISARGFNFNRIYRICSFCQKTVQKVVDK